MHNLGDFLLGMLAGVFLCIVAQLGWRLWGPNYWKHRHEDPEKIYYDD